MGLVMSSNMSSSKLRARLRASSVAVAVAHALIVQYPNVAMAAPPQDPATIDSTTQAGASFVNQGADHGNEEPASGGGMPGGDADGWDVTVNPGAWIDTAHPGALVSVHAIGGNASQGAQGGPGSNGQPGGKGGDSGNISFTASGPDGQGSIWALYQQDGSPDSYALDIRTVGGNGGKGETPSGTEFGGDPGQPGVAGDISFTAHQNPAVTTAYNFLYSAKGSTGINLYSQGGAGGAGGDTMQPLVPAYGATGGAGAKGGDMTVSIALNMSENAGTGINMTTIGGDGGQGGDGNSTIHEGHGGSGGNGGNGGDIYFEQLGGSIAAQGSGASVPVLLPDPSNPVTVSLEQVNAAIIAQSIGGSGGDTGGADGATGTAGTGGTAGSGGMVRVHLLGAGLYQAGGYQPMRDAGAINTSGDNAVGIIASSVGGAGGGTQDIGGAFSKSGGKGGAGGNAGQVYVTLGQAYSFDPDNDYALITTNGNQADGVISQSVGGGGGIGGDVNGGGLGFTIQHGGNGGNGGLGDSTRIDNGYWTGDTFVKGYQIHTKGTNSFGLLAESIGGSGGRGGNAIGAGLGVGSLVVGGNGGSGANAADATIANLGIIQTEGHQSIGAFAQSVGGGGGAGGSSLAITVGSVLTAATAIGGSGGVGGNGDLAQIFNFGQVITAGADATGLLAQSVGGGGGNAGSSLAEAFAFNPPDSPIPSFTLDLAIGGKGGAGGTGGVVNLFNGGIIATQGPSAKGMFAQSVGGGGGNGGDATAMTQAYIQSNLTVNVALGGDSGNGSAGGTVTAANSGLVLTLGDDSIGVFAQSVGGGGGNGGLGQTNQGAYQSAEGFSVDVSVGVGGKGGTGGHGGAISLYNYIDGTNLSADQFPNEQRNGYGGIMTAGVSSPGLFAQSVGGGGGNAGGGIGDGGGGKVSVKVAVGGAGGAGGDGGYVEIDNGDGGILTGGANSHGIFAQSIGGGGGNGGNATTGSGHNPTVYYPQWLATKGAALTGNTYVEQITAGFWDWRKKAADGYDELKDLNDLYEGYQQDNDAVAPTPAGNSGQTADITVDIGAGVAGAGGAAGDGGNIIILSNGGIQTLGAGSFGMFGQSVGGGGGTGGMATAATSNDTPKSNYFAAAVGLGGKDGSTGNGGSVILVNGDSGQILTERDLSHAMYGLSVGGGVGVGGASTSNASAPGGLSIAMGGDASSGGSGEAVTLTNSGQVTTQGNDAYGMLAQSIGGGGGFSHITGQTFDPDTGIAHSASTVLDSGVKMQLSNPKEGSNGGDVAVNLQGSGSISTSGVNSHGIMAQSIGGSGGIMIVDTNAKSFDGCTMWNACDNQEISQSDGGYVNINTDAGSAINTSGAGAVGIFAQAIGGGGVTVNGLNGVNLLYLKRLGEGGVPERGDTDKNWNAGYAGSIAMQVNGDITTTGDYAHGIFAQVASNGGGLVGQQNGGGFLLFGGQPFGKAKTCGDYNCPGHITVTVGDGTSDTEVSVSGQYAYGVAGVSIYQLEGGNSVHFVVNQNASIYAKGQSAGAVLIAANAGGENSSSGQGIVDNHGLIDGSQSSGKIAVQGWSGVNTDPSHPDWLFYAPYVVNNYGTIRGSVVGGGTVNGTAPQSTMNNMAGAVFEAGPSIQIGGTLTNAGTLHVGNVGTLASTELVGHLLQQVGGKLHIDADLAHDKADNLIVTGTANIAGTVHVAPTSISNRAIKVLTASSGLALDPSVATADTSHLYDFKVAAAGNDLSVAPVANFKAKAAGFGANERSVAASLQSLFDGGARADEAFTHLLAVADDAGYADGLQSLAGQGLGAFGAFRFNSSRTFAANLFGGCAGLQLEGRNVDRCGWARVLGNDTTQEAGTDTLGYEANAWELQMGGQTPLSDRLALTGSLAYEGSKFSDGNGSARITGDSVVGGLGLLFTPSRWELSAGIDAAYGWYESRRTITLGLSEEATASPKQSQLGGHVRAAWNLLDEDKRFVRPFVGGHVIHVSNKAFTEGGNSPFRLAVEGRSDTALIGVVGIEMGTTVVLSDKVTLRPFVSAALEYGSPRDWLTTARFVEQPQGDSFNLKTAGPGTLGRFSIGADLVGTKNVAFSVQYAPEIGKDFTSHSGTARLTIAF